MSRLQANRFHSIDLDFALQFLSETADNLNGLPFKLHDFGFRGSTSVEVKSFELSYSFFNLGRIAALSFCKKGSNRTRKNMAVPSFSNLLLIQTETYFQLIFYFINGYCCDNNSNNNCWLLNYGAEVSFEEKIF